MSNGRLVAAGIKVEPPPGKHSTGKFDVVLGTEVAATRLLPSRVGNDGEVTGPSQEACHQALEPRSLPRFTPKLDGVWEWMLPEPLAELPEARLTVSVRDRQGNTTRIERTFFVDR